MDEGHFIIYPYASTPVVIAMCFLFGGLIALAVTIEWARRKRQRTEAYRRSWLAVERIFREKDLSSQEREAVRELITESGVSEPLSIVTTRHAFNRTLRGFMKRKRQELEPAAYGRLGQTLRDVRTRLALDFVPYGQRIESSRELTPRQTILARPEDRRDQAWFRLVVIEVDEAFLAVEPQSIQGSSIPNLHPGDYLAARLWRRDDGRYSARFEIAGGGSAGDAILLHHDNNMQRTQARAYLRIRHNQPATVGLVNVPQGGDMTGLDARPAASRLRGRITSLSAGGLAIEADQPVPSSYVVLRVPLDLPAHELFTVHAKVVGSHALSGGRHLVRGAFIDIPNEDRDKIARFVWERQQPIGQSPHAAS